MSIRIVRLQLGMGLIEVLVAMFLFAFGVLGLAGLQLAAKRNLYEANQLALAAGLMGNIVEDMRINPGQYSLYASASFPGVDATTPRGNCRDAGCSAEELARQDVARWQWVARGESESSGSGSGSKTTGGLVMPALCIDDLGSVVKVAIAWRGLVESPNPTSSGCGESEARYGEGNLRRRILVINTSRAGR